VVEALRADNAVVDTASVELALDLGEELEGPPAG
jgi:hypothetical protein